MALTPELVRQQTFTTMRRRGGYSEDEVRSFLDRVGNDMTRLIHENATLRTQAETLNAQHAAADPTTASLRILTLAEETAQRLTSEAQAEAEEITSKARAQAMDFERAARERAQALDEEGRQHFTATMEELETRRQKLQEQITHLEAFEAESRTRLTAYLRLRLAELEPTAPAVPLATTVRIGTDEGRTVTLSLPDSNENDDEPPLMSLWKPTDSVRWPSGVIRSAV